MIDFLIMLYLAFTLFITWTAIYNNVYIAAITVFGSKTITIDKNKVKKRDNINFYHDIAACLLWAIWYMYIIH